VLRKRLGLRRHPAGEAPWCRCGQGRAAASGQLSLPAEGAGARQIPAKIWRQIKFKDTERK
jgi:hypothetical protein